MSSVTIVWRGAKKFGLELGVVGAEVDRIDALWNLFAFTRLPHPPNILPQQIK